MVYQKKLEQIIRRFDDVAAITNERITLGSSRHLLLPLQSPEISATYV